VLLFWVAYKEFSMSLASTFAAAVGVADAAIPTPFTGSAGLTAIVSDDGGCTLTIGGRHYSAPAASMTAFATWVTETFV
jgi:hypothetical protein